MPKRLERWFRERIEKSLGLLGLFGWGSLVAISLALPDFRNWQDFLAQFDSIWDAVAFVQPKIPAMALIATTIYWFYRYKEAVIKELTQLNEIFQEERAPQYYRNIEGYKLIPVIGYLLVGTYIALVLAAPHIAVYCLIALVLHAVDLTGSAITLQNLHKTLTLFPIVPTAPTAKFVSQRRDVIKQYYFGNPTLPRVGILIIVSAVTLVLSLNLPASVPEFVRYIPYVLMIANILIGEYVSGDGAPKGTASWMKY